VATQEDEKILFILRVTCGTKRTLFNESITHGHSTKGDKSLPWFKTLHYMA